MTKAEVAKNAVEGWNVEQFDEDGACAMAVFTGPDAEARAREYAAPVGPCDCGARIAELEAALQKIRDVLVPGQIRYHDIDDPFEWIDDVARKALEK